MQPLTEKQTQRVWSRVMSAQAVPAAQMNEQIGSGSAAADSLTPEKLLELIADERNDSALYAHLACRMKGKAQAMLREMARQEACHAKKLGAVYFLRQMLEKAGMDIKGQTIAISGFGNVAWGAATKATELGAKVVTISGPDGYIYDPAGLDAEKIAYMLHLRASNNDVVEPYAKKFPG